MKNQEIRETAKKKGVKFWQIADKLGMWESGFSRIMRYELSEDEKQKILDIINELAKE